MRISWRTHRVLCNKFPKEKFPPVPTRTLLRSETKSNAKKRMKELATYFENLLEMPVYVVQSMEMKAFMDLDSNYAGPSVNKSEF